MKYFVTVWDPAVTFPLFVHKSVCYFIGYDCIVVAVQTVQLSLDTQYYSV